MKKCVNSKKKLNSKCTKSVNLGGFTKKVFELLTINPTSKFVISKTGKSKSTVCMAIKRLIEKDLVKKLDRGFFKIKSSQKKDGTPLKLNSESSLLKKSNDYFRLHNIQIQLRVSKGNHRLIKNILFSDEKGFHLKDRNNNNGHYFMLDIKGLLTKENLFIFFPADFDVVADSIAEVYAKLDTILRKVLMKWENTFKMLLYKPGRVNYEIVNQHLSMVRNGIAKGLREDGISNKVKVYDGDGKVAYMFDQSKGLDEMESPHPTKAPDYIDKAKRFMDRIKSGEVEAVFEEYDDLKTVSMQNSLILKLLMKPLMDEEKAKENSEKKDENLANYFG